MKNDTPSEIKVNKTKKTNIRYNLFNERTLVKSLLSLHIEITYTYTFARDFAYRKPAQTSYNNVYICNFWSRYEFPCELL